MDWRAQPQPNALPACLRTRHSAALPGPAQHFCCSPPHNTHRPPSILVCYPKSSSARTAYGRLRLATKHPELHPHLAGIMPRLSRQCTQHVSLVGCPHAASSCVALRFGDARSSLRPAHPSAGSYSANLITEAQRMDIVQHACPGAGACGACTKRTHASVHRCIHPCSCLHVYTVCILPVFRRALKSLAHAHASPMEGSRRTMAQAAVWRLC